MLYAITVSAVLIKTALSLCSVLRTNSTHHALTTPVKTPDVMPDAVVMATRMHAGASVQYIITLEYRQSASATVIKRFNVKLQVTQTQ